MRELGSQLSSVFFGVCGCFSVCCGLKQRALVSDCPCFKAAVCYMCGASVRRCVCVCVCLQVLARAYGNSSSPLPTPVETHVTRWGLDPLAFGAYSYFAAGNSQNITGVPLCCTVSVVGTCLCCCCSTNRAPKAEKRTQAGRGQHSQLQALFRGLRGRDMSVMSGTYSVRSVVLGAVWVGTAVFCLSDGTTVVPLLP